MSDICHVHEPTAAPPDWRLNVADRLREAASDRPDSIAVACPARFSPGQRHSRRGESRTDYATITFGELEHEVTRLASGFAAWGVPAGNRLALLVRPGIEFVTLVFALLRAGVVTVLIDPGMGRRNALRRLAEAEPDGFVAMPQAQVWRMLFKKRFPKARWNVTVGGRFGWGGVTLDELRNSDCGFRIERTNPQSAIRNPQSPAQEAAIIFTSGSTGPAKGVLYTQRMFDTQVNEIQSRYGIEAGGVDLSCFPLFALFNSAMGVTTVLPEMDFSRPAAADPRKLLAAATDWQVTQAFASPAVWKKLSAHCERSGERILSLRQVFSCGAPVPADVLRATRTFVAPNAKMHTPYGATECLPVATIEAQEVLTETASKTDAGAGICVGRKFDSIEWKVIRITDEPIASIGDVEELPPGGIGELIVRGEQASPAYVTRTECNGESKIGAGNLGLGTWEEVTKNSHSEAPSPQPLAPTWHRMGDVGYLDATGCFWYCGRKSQRVETADGPMYTECVEAIFNAFPGVSRSALVGVGPRGAHTPVIVVERASSTALETKTLERELLNRAAAHSLTREIRHVLFHPALPVDVRHNAKINREQLAAWAAKQLPLSPSP